MSIGSQYHGDAGTNKIYTDIWVTSQNTFSGCVSFPTATFYTLRISPRNGKYFSVTSKSKKISHSLGIIRAWMKATNSTLNNWQKKNKSNCSASMKQILQCLDILWLLNETLGRPHFIHVKKFVKSLYGTTETPCTFNLISLTNKLKCQKNPRWVLTWQKTSAERHFLAEL